MIGRWLSLGWATQGLGTKRSVDAPLSVPSGPRKAHYTRDKSRLRYAQAFTTYSSVVTFEFPRFEGTFRINSKRYVSTEDGVLLADASARLQVQR